ncbi:MAG TPA: hypothetical protein VF773_22435 [Verrucomicrobiae bacterium]
MGCKLVRGETIYFVRHAGGNTSDVQREWYNEEVDALLLPGVFVRSEGRRAATLPSVVPIEIRTFEAS